MSTECKAIVDAVVDDINVCTEEQCTKTVTVNFVVPDCNTKADVYFDLSVTIINIDTGVSDTIDKKGLLEHIDGGAGYVPIEYFLKKGEKIVSPVVSVSSDLCNCFE